MRKFTKEIAALMASAAIGTGAAGVGVFSASSEEIVTTAGVAMNPDVTTCTTTNIPIGGVTMPPDTKTTKEEFPPLDGFMASPDEEFPPTAGEEIPPDELIVTSTVTSVTTIMTLAGVATMPPLVGTEVPTTVTSVTTTEEIIPPLAGDIVLTDGDVTGDGLFNVADVVLFQRWLSNAPDANLNNYWAVADFYKDGMLNVFDLIYMKRALLENIQTDDIK